MRNWAATALDCLATEPAAMITLAAIEGSAPREAGARMIATPTRAYGTVGGGNLEFLLIDQARRLLESDLNLLQQDYPLGPLLAQCCGGHVRVLLERLDASSETWLAEASVAEQAGQPYVLSGTISGNHVTRSLLRGWPHGRVEGVEVFGPDGPAARRDRWDRIVEHIRPVAAHLYIFGAGHVGRALAHIARTLPFRLHWHDTRPELAGSDSSLTIEPDLQSVIAAAPPGGYFVVLTHAHELDYQIVRAVLRRADATYCGLIGSATKRARFESRLTRDGVDVSGLTCPIGGGLIRSKLPAAIAVAASVELLTHLESVTNEAERPAFARQASA